jgi:hypothetical protein
MCCVFKFLRPVKKNWWCPNCKVGLCISAPKRHFCRLPVERQSHILSSLTNINKRVLYAKTQFAIDTVNIYFNRQVTKLYLKFMILRRRSSWAGPVNCDVIIHRTSSRWPTPQNQVLIDTDTDEEFNIDEAVLANRGLWISDISGDVWFTRVEISRRDRAVHLHS